MDTIPTLVKAVLSAPIPFKLSCLGLVILDQSIDNFYFCYLEMGWTHGDKVGGVKGFEKQPRNPFAPTRSATVSITNGLVQPFGTLSYAQIGRYNETGNDLSSKIEITFSWTNIDFEKYGGQSFDHVFQLCDNHQNPQSIDQTITILVSSCGDISGENCIPDKCTDLVDRSNTCTANVKAVCTPYRSPKQCDPKASFPMLTSSRYNVMKESYFLGSSGWWFHFTNDCEPAPELYCCATPINKLLGSSGDLSSFCFGGRSAAALWDGRCLCDLCRG